MLRNFHSTEFVPSFYVYELIFSRCYAKKEHTMVIMTYILWSSDFALYLENYSVMEQHTLGLWGSNTRHLTSKYL